MILSNENFRKLLNGFLVLVVLFFGVSQGIEVAHPLEEQGHLPHHAHGGMVYHELLPCDSGDHHSHFCLHSSQSNIAIQHQQACVSLKSESVCLVSETYNIVFGITCRAIRAPPFLA